MTTQAAQNIWPLKGDCQAVVCEATITCNEQIYGKNIYIGIAETKFKKDISL